MNFINKSALDLIDISKENNLVEVKKSNYIKDKLSNGLFAKKDIKKGTKIVIYFGDILDERELLYKYNNDKTIMKYIRHGNGFIIDGSFGALTKNINLFGVYVNDIFKLKSTNDKDIKHYYKSKNICNIDILKTKDFPIYVAKKDIKKGQELFVHYGIGFWLMEIGVSPIDLKKKYGKIISKYY